MPKPAEKFNPQSGVDASKFEEWLDLAAGGFAEGEAAWTCRRCDDGSVSKSAKAYARQCVSGALDNIVTFAKAYASTPEYLACREGAEDYETPILRDAAFQGTVEACAECVTGCAPILGLAAERIEETLRSFANLCCPDAARRLRLQCEAASKMVKLEAAHG